MTTQDLVLNASKAITSRSGVKTHDFAVTLGSGWDKVADNAGETVWECAAHELDGFSASGIAGHSGTIRSVRLRSGKYALFLGARTHLYEGKGTDAVVHGVNVAARCGARVMILTNGAGGIRESWQPGTPVLISDHINLTGLSPLHGAHFVDLTDLYSERLRSIARAVDPTLEEGVYVQFRGPNYETPAEVQMAKAMGGHIVGMSTALEAIAARASGMEILGLSLITNLAAGISPQPLNHEEVIRAGKHSGRRISRLLAEILWAL